jgi:hypothetical protein
MRRAARRVVVVLVAMAGAACPTNLSAGGTDSGATTDGGPPIACTCPLPAPVCHGATKLTAVGARCLDNGGCGYHFLETQCPNGCSNGLCIGDPCLGVVCDQPPSPVCLSATTLGVYSPMGACFAGGCSYSVAQQSCSSCQGGVCAGSPCLGVTCNMPPPAVCAGNVLQAYQSPGTCSSGQCTYAPVGTTCANGCQNGACQGDVCAGVTCTQPPAPACLDSMTVQTSQSPGTCDPVSGNCSYPTQMTTCMAGLECSQGACVTPPPQCNSTNCSGCCNGTTCVQLGSENSSQCGSQGAACSGCGTSTPLCQSGACVSLCADVSCNQPPASICLSSTTARQYANPGTCNPSTGACSYSASQVTCPSGETCNLGSCGSQGCSTSNCLGCCNGTACVQTSSQTNQMCGSGGSTCSGCSSPTPVCQCGFCVNPCNGVTCDQPPPDTCVNGTTLEQYSTPGTCDPSSGNCSYTATQMVCPAAPTSSCVSGACVTCIPAGTPSNCADTSPFCCGDCSGVYFVCECAEAGQPCNTSADCCYGNACVNYQCTACGTPSSSCSADSDCCSGSCSGNICSCLPSGAECDDTGFGECCNGQCNVGDFYGFCP